jgi:hypothetical protein
VIRHAVKPGERLSAIAALHGVAADDIVTANPHKPTALLPSGARVFASLALGEELAVPSALGATGDACSESSECGVGEICFQGACLWDNKLATHVPNGAPCTFDYQCDSSACQGDVCVAAKAPEPSTSYMPCPELFHAVTCADIIAAPDLDPILRVTLGGACGFLVTNGMFDFVELALTEPAFAALLAYMGVEFCALEWCKQDAACITAVGEYGRKLNFNWSDPTSISTSTEDMQGIADTINTIYQQALKTAPPAPATATPPGQTPSGGGAQATPQTTTPGEGATSTPNRTPLILGAGAVLVLLAGAGGVYLATWHPKKAARA